MTIILSATDERTLAEFLKEYPERRVVGRVVGGRPCLVVL